MWRQGPNAFHDLYKHNGTTLAWRFIHGRRWVITRLTICWPGRLPITRPAIVSTLSRPPCAAGGILLNSIEGLSLLSREQQPLECTHKNRRSITSKVECMPVRVFRRRNRKPVLQ